MQIQGTPGRRNQKTIAKAVLQAHLKLIPLAHTYGIPVKSMFFWTGTAQKVVFHHLLVVAKEYGVKPKTLVKWAVN